MARGCLGQGAVEKTCVIMCLGAFLLVVLHFGRALHARYRAQRRQLGLTTRSSFREQATGDDGSLRQTPERHQEVDRRRIRLS